MCVCVSVCVCVNERERQKERQKERKREKERKRGEPREAAALPWRAGGATPAAPPLLSAHHTVEYDQNLSSKVNLHRGIHHKSTCIAELTAAAPPASPHLLSAENNRRTHSFSVTGQRCVGVLARTRKVINGIFFKVVCCIHTVKYDPFVKSQLTSRNLF